MNEKELIEKLNIIHRSDRLDYQNKGVLFHYVMCAFNNDSNDIIHVGVCSHVMAIMEILTQVKQTGETQDSGDSEGEKPNIPADLPNPTLKKRIPSAKAPTKSKPGDGAKRR